MEGVQISIPPKNDSPGNIRSSPKTCSLKEVLRKYFINLINLSKFSAILYHKRADTLQNMSGKLFTMKSCLKIMASWLSSWVFVYKLSGCGFESRCSHLYVRYRACFEQGVSWHSGNSRVWIYSGTCTWHDKNIQSKNNSFWHKGN